MSNEIAISHIAHRWIYKSYLIETRVNENNLTQAQVFKRDGSILARTLPREHELDAIRDILNILDVEETFLSKS